MASSLSRSFPLIRRRTEAKALGAPALFVLALVAVGLVALLYLAETSAVATTGYDIKRLEDQKAQWEMKNAQLRARIAQLQSLERIEKDAKDRLNMGPSSNIVFVPVDKARPQKEESRDVLAANVGKSRTNSAASGKQEATDKAAKNNGWWNNILHALGLN